MDKTITMEKMLFAVCISILFFIHPTVLLADDTSYCLLAVGDPIIVLDQMQVNESTDFTVYNKVILAQEFTPQMTPLTQIDVRLNKPKVVDSSLRLSIRSSLNGPDLTFQSMAAEDIPFFMHWINFDIGDIDVDVGQSYFIVLEAATSVTNSYRWRSVYGEDTDYYPDGVLYRFFTQSGIWETVETETDYVDACFRTYSYIPRVDLVCSGFLNWTNVTPAQDNLTGYFTVENNGTPYSTLDWKIIHWPGWGTWQFSLMNGTGLKPEDGRTMVEVNVEAPHSNVPDEYLGKILIVNEDDENDTEEISARMVTAKQKKELYGSTIGYTHFKHSFHTLTKWNLYEFPMLRYIIMKNLK